MRAYPAPLTAPSKVTLLPACWSWLLFGTVPLWPCLCPRCPQVLTLSRRDVPAIVGTFSGGKVGALSPGTKGSCGQPPTPFSISCVLLEGTPVNRIPIMAKQVLDLYTLYQLVTDKGGLVEVINKKIWREITKGLNLPTSITSAAFTLRTQYMKYLYPYECEKRALSSPGELQAAIDSNRREGRRQTFGTALFNYSPASTPTLLGTPKMPLPALSISTHSCGQLNQVHSVKKEDGMLAASVPGHIAIPVGLAGHHLTAAQAAAASQAVVLEQLREKLETGEPPEKKVALTAEEQQRLVQHALQHNLLAMASQFPMNVKISNRDDRQETALNLSTNSISSINMSIEINGVVYTGVLFARRPSATLASGGGSTQTRPNPMPPPNPLLPASSQSHTPTSTSP
uniref:AT-rich interactive domain-containing protein 3 n=1 Tax=Cyanistes caeruleus TaxID=156563 RepID=A0A8C0U2T1_CYACU